MGFIRTAARYLGFMLFFRMLRFLFIVAFFMIIAFVVWGWLGKQAPHSATSALHGLTQAGKQFGSALHEDLRRADKNFSAAKNLAVLPAYASASVFDAVVASHPAGTVYYDFGNGRHDALLQRLARKSSAAGLPTVCFTRQRHRAGCDTIVMPTHHDGARQPMRRQPLIATAGGDVLIPVRGGVLLFHSESMVHDLIHALGPSPSPSPVVATTTQETRHP